MASRFTARLKSVLKERGEVAAAQQEADDERAALIRSYQQKVGRISEENDAKDPCWRCRNVSKGFQPYCMVDQAIVPATGCKRKQGCGHAG